ncbi:uncharacterized protein [Thunnus thynnus]|uniref:uncharacterized protein n=1 Tax=Thunnus thynnus TaxID=8237 RepID=UPI003526E5CD
MAVAQVPFLAAVLLLVSSGFHCSSTPPACPESCTCQRAPLLNCSSSGLSLVPQHIQDSVTELDLSHNLLDFVTLHRPHRNLRNVWLGNNSITRLSLCIERAPRSQYVRGRRLHRLRPWSRGCVSWAPTLQLLSVERNQLVQLPEGLDGMKSLQVLQLSFNRISTLQPGVLSKLRQLKELHLQHNLITSLHPQMFQDLAQLRVLDLSFNMLTSLHPLMYLSLRNVGADVSLGGNRWQCDCSMRSLRRRMAYDSSRSLQSWSIVCASPSILSGRDLLQLEENDLNCFSTESRPELHQDVTVYSGSEILLSCSMQDSFWWTPNNQASVSQPQAGLLIRDITEGDTGLYVCMSEEHEVISVFNLHISRIGGTRRKTRSLSRTSQQIMAQGTSNRMGQEGNQRTQSDFVLAVCLSVFITFLIAFILGVLARPLFDVLCRRVTNKSSSETHSVSSVEQSQYDNEAYANIEELEGTRTYSERRVTFSTVDFREEINVQYYDAVTNEGQESIYSRPVIKCKAAEAEKDKHTADDSGSENSLRQNSPEDNQRDVRDHTHNMEVEDIPDRVVLEKRRSLSSHSDSSLSDKELKEDQMTQGHHTLPKSPQLVEDSVQQSVDFSTARKVDVPQCAIEGTSEIHEFSSERFVDRLPHTNTHNLEDLALWQEDGEPFEFSDSVRSTSARSSSMFGSFNHSKLIVAPTSDKQRGGDMSSSSSYVSEDEPSHYTVNSDQEEEEDIVRNYTEPDVCFEQQIHNIDPVRPSLGINHGDYRHDLKIKKRLDIKAPSPPADSSSSSDSEDETTNHIEKHEQEMHMESLPIKVSQTVSQDPETEWPTVNLEHTTRIKRRLDIKAPSPTSGSSSSSDSEDEKTNHIKKQGQGETYMARPPINVSPTVSHESGTQWPTLDLEHIPRITRRLDIKAPSPPPDSSSSSEDETISYLEKQRPAKVNIAALPFQETQAESHDSETWWPILDLEHTTRIKRHLDIKAPSPTSDSSSSSDSEHETTNHLKKQGQGETYMARSPIKVPQIVSHEPETQWPTLDLEHIPRITRRLDIKAPSPPPDSSSRSEDKNTGYIEKQRPATVNIAALPFQETRAESHDPETWWPILDLEHTTHVKRHLDIKAPSPTSDSSSTSDSEDETIGYTEKQRPGKVKIAGLPFQETQAESHDPETWWPILDLEHTTRIKRRLDIKAPSPTSDSTSSSDSEHETTNHIKKQEQGEMYMVRPPIKVSQTVSHDPETQWPTLDLEHIPRITRRLDIKAPSPPPDSSSSSDSEDETTGYIEKQRPAKVNIAGLQFQETQAESHDPETQWPTFDLEHIPRITRRLDIKAPSPPPDSSSSSDSEDETTGYIEKQRPAKVNIAALPYEETRAESHDPETQWPTFDLEHIPRITRRLDIKAPSPPPDSSSSSDSEDETTNHIKKQEQGETYMVRPPIKVSQTVSHDPETQWPIFDLEHIPRITRRLDIKTPSPRPDSSSSRDSEDETTGYIEKQRPAKVNIAGLQFQETQAESHDPETQWPTFDLEHIPRITRRLDIKAPSPPPDSSSSSDSEDETTNHIKKQEQGETYMVRPPIKVSQTVSHDPETQWPTFDLEHIPHITRRLDIKTPSPRPDSSSSRDSEDETTGYIEKQRPAKVNIAGLQFQETQAESHDPETQWPTFDLEHIPRITRRLDIKAPSPPPDSSSSSDSEDETTGYIEKQRPAKVNIAALPYEETRAESRDPETQWPAFDLEHTTRIKRRLDIKAPSPASDSSDSEDETTDHTERERPGVGKFSGLSFQKSQTVSHNLGTQWPAVDLGRITRIKRRLDIKASSPPSDSLSNGASQGSRQSKSNSSTSDSEDEDSDHKAKPSMGAYAVSKAKEKEFIRSPKTPAINISHRPKTDHNIKLEKYTIITDDFGDKTTRDNISTTPEINPELQSRWATMNLGFSRFRKHLEITPPTNEPPNLPLSSPPDSPSSSSSESGIKSKNSRTKQTPENKQVNVSLSLKGQDDNPDNSVDIENRLRKAYSLPSTEDHSVPDLSLGVPHVKRRLNIKAPSPQPSNSPSSCSDSENEVIGYTAKQTYSRHASNLSGKTDDDSLINYKRSIIKSSSLPSESFPSNGKAQTTDHTRQRHTGAEIVTPQRGSFHAAVKRKIEQFRHTTDVDLPPEIRWTGVGRHLSDLSISSPRRHLDVNLLSPQQAPFAKPEHPPPDSSNSTSSEGDDKIKQGRGKVDATSMHKYSSLSSSSISLSSSRVFGKLDNSSTNTNEIWRVVSTDRGERKGLSALKAMSSDRQKWDTEDEKLDIGTSPLCDDQGPQRDMSSNHHRSEEYIKPLAKQTKPEALLSSTSINERSAEDLLYDIPRYRSHVIEAIDPPQELPPPVPETPPPDEAADLTWRSPQNSTNKEYESRRSNLQQRRSMEEPDPSLTPENLAVYFDSSYEITEV